MALLDYNRKTSFNVIPKEDFQELIKSTFTSVSEIMSKSLGPLGSTTTILDGMYTSATKDGWTIFKHLRQGNIYRAMIFNLIQGPCSKLNNTVGDGTTTAIVLTNEIFQAYRNRQEALSKLYRLPREFNREWDRMISMICDRIQTYAVQLPVDSVYDVAYVASNGNDEISTNLRNIYNQSASPVVKLRSSPTNTCYVEAIKGYEFPTNLTDDAYVRNDDMSGTYDDIATLIFGFKVESDLFEKIIVPINNVYRAMGIRLLVIAPAYDELLANTVMKTYANKEWQHNDHKFNLIVSQFQYNKLKDHQLDDLGVLTGGHIIDRYRAQTIIENIESHDDLTLYDLIEEFHKDRKCDQDPFDFRHCIGVAPTVRLTVDNGSTFMGFDTANNDRYQTTMQAAIVARDEILNRTSADKQNFSMEVGRANARIAQLQMETYMYYVGANSSLQVSVLETAVDDVIKAVRSAVGYGIVPGCQISIMRACYELREDLSSDDATGELDRAILDIIADAAVSVYHTVLTGPDNLEISAPKGYEPSVDTFHDIVKGSIERFTAYDLELSEYNSSLVTSVETDINVLTAASELIKLLISGNQCVYIDSTLNNSDDIT